MPTKGIDCSVPLTAQTAAALATLLSYLTSLAGLPEVKDDDSR